MKRFSILVLVLFVLGCATNTYNFNSSYVEERVIQIESFKEQYDELPDFKALVIYDTPNGLVFFPSSGQENRFAANRKALKDCNESLLNGSYCNLITEGKDDILRPAVFRKPLVYPNGAFSSGIIGCTVTEFDVLRSGLVANARVINSYPRFIFDETSLNQVRSSAYPPYRLNIIKKVQIFNSYGFELWQEKPFECEVMLANMDNPMPSHKYDIAKNKKRIKAKKELAANKLEDYKIKCKNMGFVESLNILNCAQKERQHEELMAKQKSLIAAEKQRLTLNQPPPEQGFWAQMGEALLEGMEEGFALGMEQRIYERAGINNSYSGGYYSSNPSSINQVNCLEQKINRLERRTGTRVCKDGNCYYEAPKYDFSGIFGQDACIKYK